MTFCSSLSILAQEMLQVIWNCPMTSRSTVTSVDARES